MSSVQSPSVLELVLLNITGCIKLSYVTSLWQKHRINYNKTNTRLIYRKILIHITKKILSVAYYPQLVNNLQCKNRAAEFFECKCYFAVTERLNRYTVIYTIDRVVNLLYIKKIPRPLRVRCRIDFVGEKARVFDLWRVRIKTVNVNK